MLVAQIMMRNCKENRKFDLLSTFGENIPVSHYTCTACFELPYFVNSISRLILTESVSNHRQKKRILVRYLKKPGSDKKNFVRILMWISIFKLSDFEILLSLTPKSNGGLCTLYNTYTLSVFLKVSISRIPAPRSG